MNLQDTKEEEQQVPGQEKPENVLFNLLFNIIIPGVILFKFSDKAHLGPVWGLIIALSFPLGYGIGDLISKKKWNMISIFGLLSVLFTGGLALFKLEGHWFAVKEAAFPAVIGIVVFFSYNTKYSIVKMMLFNPKIINVEEIKRLVEEKGVQKGFEKLLKLTHYMITSSFILSAVLNFVLAIWLLKSPTGTPEFNKELGKMTALSFPVIMVPCMIVMMGSLWVLIRGLTKITGLEFNQIIRDNK